MTNAKAYNKFKSAQKVLAFDVKCLKETPAAGRELAEARVAKSRETLAKAKAEMKSSNK